MTDATTDKWKALLPEIDIIPLKVELTTEKIPPETRNKGKYANIVYKNPFVYSNMNVAKTRKKEKQPPIVTNKKWSCMICNEIAVGKEDLIKHYEKHREEEKEADFKDEEDSSTDYFLCQTCSKEFTSLKSYERHTEVQHGEFLYTCETCSKAFKNSYQFCLHNYDVHTDDGTYKCNHCEFTTQEKSQLKSHLNTHKEDYKYRCKICDKGFTVYNWYVEHENIHTGARPFECEVCTKCFAYNRYLVAHKRSMHPELFSKNPIVHKCKFCKKRFAHKKSVIIHERCHTGENIVLCEVCGKRLTNPEHLKHHMRIHTGDKPHKCGICGKGFAKKCNLTLHERVHSGERPYHCRFCEKSFSQRSTVVIHERYHTGERPYVCTICNKGFVAKGLLGPHMRTCGTF